MNIKLSDFRFAAVVEHDEQLTGETCLLLNCGATECYVAYITIAVVLIITAVRMLAIVTILWT